jgi:hypothetical protein
MRYNVSVYNDAFLDSDHSLWGTTTTDDQSSGCAHSSYVTTSAMTSPGGNSTTQSSGGMVANSGLQLDNFGTYWVYGSVQFYNTRPYLLTYFATCALAAISTASSSGDLISMTPRAGIRPSASGSSAVDF